MNTTDLDLDYLQQLMGGTVEKSPQEAWRDIWVIAETRGGTLASVTREALGRAHDLAAMLGAHVVAVLIGHRVQALAADAIAYGADIVHVADHPLMADYRVETYTRVLAGLITEKKPEIVLLAATTRGRDLAPRLATRLKTGLLSECIALDIDESERLLLATRPTHQGMMMATVACPTARPQIATVRGGCLRALPADTSREGTIMQTSVTLDESDTTTTIEPAARPVHRVPLTDARIVVGGGRGIGGAEGFAILQQLADALGGDVAASRSAVELGWATPERMVDVTATHIHPDLYVAVGISGSFPHRFALRGTRCLVAINHDAHAPIMKRADYAIEGDWREVVPALISSIKEAQQT